MSAIYTCEEYNQLYQKLAYMLAGTSVNKIEDRFERLHELNINQEAYIDAFGKKVVAMAEDYERQHRKQRRVAHDLVDKLKGSWPSNVRHARGDYVYDGGALAETLDTCLALLPQTWSEWSDMAVLAEVFYWRAVYNYVLANFEAARSDCKHATDAVLNFDGRDTVRSYYQAEDAYLLKLVALQLALLRALQYKADDVKELLASLNLTIDVGGEYSGHIRDHLVTIEDQLAAVASVDLFLEALPKLANFIDTAMPTTSAAQKKKKKEKPTTMAENFKLKPSIQLVSDAHGGRFYQTEEHLTKGETILIEKSRSLVLFHEQLGKFCTNCYKDILTAWPCPGCTEVFFCSAQCARHAHDTFHREECGLYGFMLGDDNFYSLPHVFRFYCQFGVELATRVELAGPEQYSLEDFVGNYLSHQAMQRCSIEEMNQEERELCCRALSSLLSHRNKRDASRELCHTLVAYALVYLLKHRGQLNGWLDEDENGSVSLDKLSQLAECLATAMMRTSTNGFCWGMTRTVGPHQEEELIRVASCVCLVASFLNHSCTPNVTWNIEGGTIELTAQRDIEPGESLTICYGPRHSTPFEQRQYRLRDDYLFFCRCELCLVDSARNEPLTLRCFVHDSCPGPMVMNKYGSCLTCGESSSMSTKQLNYLLMDKAKAVKKFARSISSVLTKAHRGGGGRTRFDVKSMMCLPLKSNKDRQLSRLIKKYSSLFTDGLTEVDLGGLRNSQKMVHPDHEPKRLVLSTFVVDRFHLEVELSSAKLAKIMKHYIDYTMLAYAGSYQHLAMLADLFYLHHRHGHDQFSLPLLPGLSCCLEVIVPAEFDSTFKEQILQLEFIAIYLTHLATKKADDLAKYYGDNVADAISFHAIAQAVNTKLLSILQYDRNHRGNFFPRAHRQISTKSATVDNNNNNNIEREISSEEKVFTRMFQQCQARLHGLDGASY